jgi:peptide methionine sulfoxide reductase msrA/msrB
MPLRMKAVALIAAVVLALAGWKSLNALAKAVPVPVPDHVLGEKTMSRKVHRSEEEWKLALSPEKYRVLRQGGTELPFTGKYNNFFESGTYVCAACGAPLFSSTVKYDHGCGWPSFTQPVKEANIEFIKDSSFGLERIEVRCAVCGSHLGHVFPDGPGPTYERYCINSASLGFIPEPGAVKAKDGTDDPGPVAAGPSSSRAEAASTSPATAVFAAGCFWGVEYKFSHHKGVLATRVGYTGGTMPDPTYAQVCTDRTGHAEAVEVRFDPSKLSYEELVRFFFTLHDPTQVDRQGVDVGTQYRSVIFYRDESQKAVAEKVIAELDASGRYRSRIATGLVPAGVFYPAEEYHQKYYEKHDLGACAR